MLGPDHKASLNQEASVRPRHGPWEVVYSKSSLLVSQDNYKFTATNRAAGLLADLAEAQDGSTVKSGLDPGSGTSYIPKPCGNDVGVGIFAPGELVTPSLASKLG